MDQIQLEALFQRAKNFLPELIENGSKQPSSDALQIAYKETGRDPWIFMGVNSRNFPVYIETDAYVGVKTQLLPKLRLVAREQKKLFLFSHIHSWMQEQIDAGVSEETLRDIGYQF